MFLTAQNLTTVKIKLCETANGMSTLSCLFIFPHDRVLIVFFYYCVCFFKSILHFAAIFVAHYDMKVVGKVPIPYRMQELHSTYLAEHQDTNKIDLRGLINN